LGFSKLHELDIYPIVLSARLAWTKNNHIPIFQTAQHTVNLNLQ